MAFRQIHGVGVLIAIFRSSIPSPPIPLCMLRRIPRGTLRNTRGRAGRYPLLVRLLHSLLRAGLSRRTDFHFGRPGLAPLYTQDLYTPKTFCLNRFAVAAHWACPLNRQRAVREGLAEQPAVVLGRFFDTSPTLRPVVAHGLMTPSAVNRPVRAAPRSAGASPRTAAASDGSPPAGASSNARVSPAAHPS